MLKGPLLVDPGTVELTVTAGPIAPPPFLYASDIKSRAVCNIIVTGRRFRAHEPHEACRSNRSES